MMWHVLEFIIDRRQGVCNLQACWPIRRHFWLNTTSTTCSIPSGVVTGDVAGIRDLKLRGKCGGEKAMIVIYLFILGASL
jgi:hypothetical protein